MGKKEIVLTDTTVEAVEDWLWHYTDKSYNAGGLKTRLLDTGRNNYKEAQRLVLGCEVQLAEASEPLVMDGSGFIPIQFDILALSKTRVKFAVKTHIPQLENYVEQLLRDLQRDFGLKVSKARKHPDTGHHAFPPERRRELVETFRIARQRGKVSNKRAWAKSNYGISLPTLNKYLKEWPDAGKM